MKKIYYLALALTISFASCEVEPADVDGTIDSSLENATENTVVEEEIEIEELEEIQSQFFSEVDDLDLQQIGNLDLQEVDLRNSETPEKGDVGTERYRNRPRVTSLCLITDADRCPLDQPTSNMWWPRTENDYFDPTAFFSSSKRCRMIFATFSNGTALIRGITLMNEGKCKVYVNVWLKDKQTWDEWRIPEDNDHKREGCAGDNSKSENMDFYVINSAKSYIYTYGNDCIGQGLYGLAQRPDPNDPYNSNFGAHVGPGGANYDSDLDAKGLSTWGYITDRHTGEHLWIMDFNFKLRCCPRYH